MSRMTTKKITSIGQLMTEKLETIDLSDSAQKAAKKMRDKNVSSLIVVDDNSKKPIGIVTERDLVIKVCTHDAHSSTIVVNDIMSSPLATTDALSPVEVAAEIMSENKVRHLLVVEDDDINKPLGIITPTDFVGYLKENLNIDDVNARILQSIQETKEDDGRVSEDLEQEGKLPKNPQKGGEEYEDEKPRQGSDKFLGSTHE
jgi:signal-transduction protein with cAMP-binding, CBS, and nucleotidyltransferase domain